MGLRHRRSGVGNEDVRHGLRTAGWAIAYSVMNRRSAPVARAWAACGRGQCAQCSALQGVTLGAGWLRIWRHGSRGSSRPST
jgi:hypothetical protein